MFCHSIGHRALVVPGCALLLLIGGCSGSTPEKPVAAGTLLPDHRTAPPAAEFVDGTIPEGSTLRLTMSDSLGSKTTRKGDLFRATLNEAAVADGLTILPAGSVFQGIVDGVATAQEGGPRGGGSLTLAFKVVYTPTGSGGTVAAELSEVGARGAAGNSLSLSSLKNGTSAAAVIAAPRGKEAEIAAGTPVAIVLTEPLTLKVKKD